MIGATSGSGFALFENLTIGAAAEAWTFITLTRLGTAAVHIFTAGLMGWGLASAFKEKKKIHIVSTFIGAVALHGIWNGLNILAAVSELTPVQEQLGPFVTGLAAYIPVALVILALGCFWLLIRVNKYLRRAIMAGSD
jgi:RsiW-degrading membrane proteinase PrsW (M82 family)